MGRKSAHGLDIDRFRVPPGGRNFRLRDVDPADERGLPDRAEAAARTAADIARIDALQDMLYAQRRRALLCVFQAMDCGGKDSTIKHVFGPIDPLGIVAANFKQPTERELAQDFLWRVHRAVPPKGMIGLFNRSHYEDVLIARVHRLAPAGVIEQRYDQINAFEKQLAENDVTILKFFLHISKAEQRRRLQDRLDDPRKHWKFNPADLGERARWGRYMKAYEIALRRCSTAWAPWFVIPANHNWYRNAVVARIVRRALEGLHLKFPQAEFDPARIAIE